MGPIFKTKMLISFRPIDLEDTGKVHVWKLGFHILIWSMIYLRLK